LVEAAIGELHLRLDADGSRYMPAFDADGEVVQQRALTGAGLSAEHGDSAPTGEHIGQEAVECLTLGAASEEPRGLTGTLRRRPPAPFNDPSLTSQQERISAVGGLWGLADQERIRVRQ
jgi:hypothetical protein